MSFLAMMMHQSSRGWLVLRLNDDSPLALSLVIMAYALPLTFVSLLGGAFADRFSRKHIIMASQSGNALLTTVLATLDITGLISFWHLIVIGLANGTLASFNMPSRQSRANGLNRSQVHDIPFVVRYRTTNGKRARDFLRDRQG